MVTSNQQRLAVKNRNSYGNERPAMTTSQLKQMQKLSNSTSNQEENKNNRHTINSVK
jgi:hypothetical protein